MSEMQSVMEKDCRKRDRGMIDFDFRPEIVVVDSLPGLSNPRIFFELRDDLGVNLVRSPMTEKREKELVEGLEKYEGKIYCVASENYARYIYASGEWWKID